MKIDYDFKKIVKQLVASTKNDCYKFETLFGKYLNLNVHRHLIAHVKVFMG